MFRKFLLVVITVLSCFYGHSQDIQFMPDEKSERLYSHQLIANGSYKPDNVYSDSLPVNIDDEYALLVDDPSSEELKIKSVQDYVFVGINHDTNIVYPAHSYIYYVSLSILCFDYNSPASPTTKNVTLTVSYNADSGKSYIDANVFKFSGYHKLIVVVTDVKDGTGTTISRAMDMPKNFYIMSTIAVERYDSVAFTIYPWSEPANNNKTLHITWGTDKDDDLGCADDVTNNNIKPVEFELEWTYVDDYNYSIYDGISGSKSYLFNSSSDIPYDFRKNSTRVRLLNNFYDIPLVYEHGAIVYRIRPLRPNYDDHFKSIIYGAWNMPAYGITRADSPCRAYFISAPHTADSLNWQYTINFAEEGKYKHAIHYFDGSLRERQTQTKINTDNDYIIAIDKTYDKEGRASIQTLPVPVVQSYLYYNPLVTVNSATSKPYQAADFDNLSCTAPDSIAPLASSALAKIYYSSLNPDKTGMQRYVPDARGYPFIQSIISPDNLLLWQGGAGYENQLWLGHGTRHEYLTPVRNELLALFGDNVADTNYYREEIITDPNGQTSFSISNMQGKMVATGLIGYIDSAHIPIDVLPGYDTGGQDCQQLTGYITPYYNDKNGLNSLEYSLSMLPFPVITANCDTQFLLTKAYYSYDATDDCGASAIPKTTGVLGADTILQHSGWQSISADPVEHWLAKGKYVVNSHFDFSRPEVNGQVKELVLNNEPDCFHDDKYFVRKAVEASHCPCYDAANDTGISPCEAKKRKMMAEMSPGGKYGRYTNDRSTFYEYHYPLTPDYPATMPNQGSFLSDRSDWNSIFSIDYVTMPGMYGSTGYNRNLGMNDFECKWDIPESDTIGYAYRYQDTSLHLPDVWKNGKLYTNIDCLPVDTFIYIFNDTIAEALLPLHPEYCRLKICYSNDSFLTEFESCNTFQQAASKNMFDLDSLIDQEPLYKNADVSSRLLIKQQLTHFRNYPKRIDSLALEQAYAFAGNAEEGLHVAKFVYKSQIGNFSFIDDNVKQTYFEILKSYFLSKRQNIKHFLYEDPYINLHAPMRLLGIVAERYLVGNCSCVPIGHGIILTDTPVFDTPPKPDSDMNTLLDSFNAPDWIKDVFADASDEESDHSALATPPSELQDSITAGNAILIDGAVSAIVSQLGNCTTDTTKLLYIRNELSAYIHAHGIESLTPQVVANAITNPSGANLSLNDLCHPFLVGYTNMDIEQDKAHAFVCPQQEMFTGIKDLLNRAEMKTAMINATLTGSTAGSFSLSGGSNAYEAKVAAFLSVSNTATINVKGFLDTIQFSPTSYKKYVRLMLYATGGSDTLKLFFKRKLASSPYIDGATSLKVMYAGCLNDDRDAVDVGYVGRSTAVINFSVDACTRARYYMWSNGLNIMDVSSGETLSGALSCVDIRKAIDTFVVQRKRYKYDDAYDHPLFYRTLGNYLNYRFHKNFSTTEYLELAKGCALCDYSLLRKHQAMILVKINDTTTARHFRDALHTYTDRHLIDLDLLRSTMATMLYVNFHTVPEDSLLVYKTAILHIADSLGVSATYLPNPRLMVFRDPSCTPPFNLTSTITSGSWVTEPAYINMDGTLQGCTLYELIPAYSSIADHTEALRDAYDYAAGCTGTYVLDDAAQQEMQPADYSSADKQAYLEYIYGYMAGSATDIATALTTANTRTNISSFTAYTLSYTDLCDKYKKNLYICNGSQSAGTGLHMLRDTIIGKVKIALGSDRLFLAKGVNSTSPSTSLSIFRKASGVHWYRFFKTDNRLYNVYLAPPDFPELDIHTLTYDSLQVGPGKDSLYIFTVFMHYGSDIDNKVQCKGYADFAVGYGREVSNVILYKQPGINNCIDSFDCEYKLLHDAIFAGHSAYGQYYDSVTTSLTDSMLTFLYKNTGSSMVLCKQSQRNHITRYYYDPAGNLIQTISPGGYEPGNMNNILKSTIYRYNSRNELTSQRTPDAGTTEFFRDYKGNVIFSQNSKQKPDSNYSYTLYDGQERIVETGEVKLGCGSCTNVTNVGGIISVHGIDSITSYVRRRIRYSVVRTYYDEAVIDLDTVSGYLLNSQENLLGRVSAIYFYNSKAADYNSSTIVPPNFGTYHSYDLSGNVKTIVYDCMALEPVRQRYKRVDYDYDQVSGKINMLSYNRGMPDQFYHKYTYDADNRITKARTSRDGVIWNRDAEYTYYKHGPLAKVKIGDDQLQSMEYAYTIQGWLKAINGDILKPAKDMGDNGEPGDLSYARDAMAMSLDYYHDDYKSIDNAVVENLTGPSKQLFNGNIAGQTLSLNTVGSLQRTYQYDQVQRIKLASYAAVDESNLTVASPSNIFKNSYQYDADGNIKCLKRYDNTAALMDSFRYFYKENTNRLRMVDEQLAGSTTPPHDIERPGYSIADSNNYSYDSIGNLVRDRYANQTMEWDVYGKIRSITDTATEEEVHYEYDGLGNRVRKDVVSKISGELEAHHGEYYVHDATGNILATYNFKSSYSPYALITAANGGLYSSDSFIAFLLHKVDPYGDFGNQFALQADSLYGSWVDGFMSTKPLSFYFTYGDGIKSRLMLEDNSWISDYQAWEISNNTTPITPGVSVFARACSDAGTGSEITDILSPILDYSTEGTNMLEHFLTEMDVSPTGADLDNLFNNNHIGPFHHNVGTTYAADAAALYAATTGSKATLLTDMMGIISTDIAVNSGVHSLSFYADIFFDNSIFASSSLRLPTPPPTPFETAVGNVLLKYAGSSDMNSFFNGWTGANTWIGTNVTRREKALMMYLSDKAGTLDDFITTIDAGHTALNHAIASTDKVSALNYVQWVKAHPTLSGLTTMMDSYLGIAEDTVSLAAHYLYGSSRLGIQYYTDSTDDITNTYNIDDEVTAINKLGTSKPWYSYVYGDLIQEDKKEPWNNGHTGDDDTFRINRRLGLKYYELTDHTGNVVITLMDRKSGHVNPLDATHYDYWLPDIADISDYYPFGMKMPTRFVTSNHHHGYNGQMSERELFGSEDNHYAFKYREYDPRTGRFWSVDPLAPKYPWNSTYAFAEDRVIDGRDLEGLEWKPTSTTIGGGRDNTAVLIINYEALDKVRLNNQFQTLPAQAVFRDNTFGAMHDEYILFKTNYEHFGRYMPGVSDLDDGLNLVGSLMKGNNRDAAAYAAGFLLPAVSGKILKETVGPLHHIFTNKNFIRGQQWSKKFAPMFEKAGYKLNDAINKVNLIGHNGPHPEEYHQAVYDRLIESTKGLEGNAYKDAFEKTLETLKKEISTEGTQLNKMLTKKK